MPVREEDGERSRDDAPVADGTLDDSAVLCAAGDGWLDTDLLLAADHAIRPRHGELESLGWSAPGLTITAVGRA